MYGFVYTCSEQSTPVSHSTSEISGYVSSIYGNDIQLTCVSSGVTSVVLDLGIGIRCLGYGTNSFTFKSWLILSKHSSWSVVSGSTIAISSRPVIKVNGSTIETEHTMHSSNLTLNDITTSGYIGDYSATSYRSNGVIGVSTTFTVKPGTTNFSVYWVANIGGKSVTTGAININTSDMLRTLTYNYNGFTDSSPAANVKRTAGTSITLANASSATKTPTDKPTTKSINFNLNGGEGVFNSITRTYSNISTYTPTRWDIGSFGSNYTLNNNTTANLQYDTHTPGYSYEYVNIPSDKPTQYGYTFSYWSSTYGNYAAGASIYLDKDYNLNAEYAANTYKIVYHADGWNNVPASAVKTYGTNFNVSSNTLTKNGYRWNNQWKTKNGDIFYKGDTLDDYIGYKIALSNGGVVDLYMDGYSICVNKIQLNAGSGTLPNGTINPIEYTVEGQLTTITQPTTPPGNYVFVGWTSDKAICGQSYTDTSVIQFQPSKETSWNRTITLTARYVQLGKFVNIRGSWRPIMRTYYKLNGQWVQTERADDTKVGVGKVYTKVNGAWKKEIGS